mmetsp:Transcript_331/g.1316  ORF Transcript_331/g.1316 Transcript_331/m.1316 type:complete len:429 (+) Transcript_331:159-1445(+)
MPCKPAVTRRLYQYPSSFGFFFFPAEPEFRCAPVAYASCAGVAFSAWPLYQYPAEKDVIFVALVSSSAAAVPFAGSTCPALSNSQRFSRDTSIHPGWLRAAVTFDIPGSFPRSRTSVRPLTEPVTLPLNDSIIALALALPKSKPWPPPSWGNTPVRTTVLPARQLAAASPALGLGTMKPLEEGFFFLGLTTATTADGGSGGGGALAATGSSFLTFPLTFPGLRSVGAGAAAICSRISWCTAVQSISVLTPPLTGFTTAPTSGSGSGLARAAASSATRTSSTLQTRPGPVVVDLPAFSAAAYVALARFFPVSAAPFAGSSSSASVCLPRPRARVGRGSNASSAATTSASATGATRAVDVDAAHAETSITRATTIARCSKLSSSNPQNTTSFIARSARSNATGSGSSAGLGRPWWTFPGTRQHSACDHRP